jgi:hypothetical protein
MGTSGRLTRAYIQLCTDFKVQLELYVRNPNIAILGMSKTYPRMTDVHEHVIIDKTKTTNQDTWPMCYSGSTIVDIVHD